MAGSHKSAPYVKFGEEFVILTTSGLACKALAARRKQAAYKTDFGSVSTSPVVFRKPDGDAFPCMRTLDNQCDLVVMSKSSAFAQLIHTFSSLCKSGYRRIDLVTNEVNLPFM
jgi:hypothetical protein